MFVPHALLRRSFVHALGTVAYIALVATVMSNAEQIFGRAEGQGEAPLVGVAMLLLFVLSASITGLLVLGTPVRWYLDGKKQEAVQLLGCTVGWLALFAIISLFLLAIR
jgi:hypothetical protein